MAAVEIWFNPRCSKCRGADVLLREHGIDPRVVRYLDDPPSREELERVLTMLGTDDPRELMRTHEPEYRELRLEEADRDTLLDAMTEHPRLIERPVVIRDGRAVIARPPERLLELLAD